MTILADEMRVKIICVTLKPNQHTAGACLSNLSLAFRQWSKRLWCLDDAVTRSCNVSQHESWVVVKSWYTLAVCNEYVAWVVCVCLCVVSLRLPWLLHYPNSESNGETNMAKKCELEVKGLNLLLIKVKLQAEKKKDNRPFNSTAKLISNQS